MQVKDIAECSKGSILQYFGPSLSYHLSLRSMFCLPVFWIGSFSQVLLYNADLKISFFKKILSGINTRMSNSLDPDQTQHFVGPNMDPNCLQSSSTGKKIMLHMNKSIY